MGLFSITLEISSMLRVTIICLMYALHDCFKDVCRGYDLLRGRRAFLEKTTHSCLRSFLLGKVWQGSTDTNSICHSRVQPCVDEHELLCIVQNMRWLPETWFFYIDQGRIYALEELQFLSFFIAVMGIRSTHSGSYKEPRISYQKYLKYSPDKKHFVYLKIVFVSAIS